MQIQSSSAKGRHAALVGRRSRSTTATVLDVHEIKRGERAGYRQRVCPADGWIVVVAGGTSHGIGMEAPTSAKTVRHRAIAFATGSLGCRAGTQPVHNQRQEALVSRAATHAIEPDFSAPQGAAAPDRTGGSGRLRLTTAGRLSPGPSAHCQHGWSPERPQMLTTRIARRRAEEE